MGEKRAMVGASRHVVGHVEWFQAAAADAADGPAIARSSSINTPRCGCISSRRPRRAWGPPWAAPDHRESHPRKAGHRLVERSG
jgi:hypothetical protein